MTKLLESKYVLDVQGDAIEPVDEWINLHLIKDVDYTYMLSDVFPPRFRYYFKCPHQHLMAVLKS
jgi:hypothetical protein